MSELRDVLAAGAKELSIHLTGDQLLKIEKYYSLLIEANKNINLTAITEEREAAIKHFLDSLTCLCGVMVEDWFKVIDIGTGAGFPGLPIKICQPGIHLTLVEAVEKKVKFLREVVAALELPGTVVIHARAEDIGRDKAHREQYDLALSRAVASLPVLAEYCLPVVKHGGLFVAMKGPNVDQEIKAAAQALTILGGSMEKVINFKLPLLGDERNLLLIRKVAPTPAKYPRRAGTPQKKPL